MAAQFGIVALVAALAATITILGSLLKRSETPSEEVNNAVVVAEAEANGEPNQPEATCDCGDASEQEDASGDAIDDPKPTYDKDKYPYVVEGLNNPSTYEETLKSLKGKVFGKTFEGGFSEKGECVGLVKENTGMYDGVGVSTSSWSQGEFVKDNDIPIGTAIATFVDKEYPSSSQHAAIYLGKSDDGIIVLDQWNKYEKNVETGEWEFKEHRPAEVRTIRYKTTENKDYRNNGDYYYVIK